MRKYLKKIPLYIIYSILFGVFISNPAFADTVDYNVNVAPSLKLTIPASSIILNLNPPTKTFDSEDFTVEVGTNNQTGYTLTLSTPNDDTFLNRDSSSDGVSAKLYTLDTGTYTETTFTPDKWGYSINSNTAIPSTITSGYVPFQSGNTLMESSTAVNKDETELTFAAKIDYLQPAGSYATDLIFNLVANPLVQYMQDLDPSLCTTTPQTVLDERDGQEYIVQRLADGNCWLLENLRLDLTDPAVQAKLTSSTTNATDANLTNLKNNVSTSWSNTYTAPKINTAYKDTIQPASGSAPAGKIGVYYNFCAASAGSYCMSSGSENASQDVCPVGWRMPTYYPSGVGGEYQALYTAYGSNAASFMSALNTILSGRFLSGAADSQGTFGFIWSSTREDADFMYGVQVSTTSVGTNNSGMRDRGYPVRCILKDTRNLNDITYMQDINSQIVANTAVGTMKVLKDNRDNEEYTIAKQSDGNFWMLDNLNLDLTSQSVADSLSEQNTNANLESINALKSGGGSGTNGLAVNGLTYTNWASGTSYTQPLARVSGTCSTSGSYPCTYSGPYNKDSIISDLTPATSAFGFGNGKIGIQYNICAMSAGSYCYNSNATTPATVQYDICPSGWHIPTNNEIKAVCTAIRGSACSGTVSMTATSASSMQYKLSLDLTGAVGETGGVHRQGTYHFMGLATKYDNTHMYRLYSSSSTLVFDSYSTRTPGYNIRCVAK